MPSSLATVIFAIGIVGLFVLGRDRSSRPSKALWVPVIAFLIAGSRPLSQWLDALAGHTKAAVAATPGEFVDASPVDAALSVSLIVLSLIVLSRRRRHIWNLLRQNAPILIFFSYCAISVLWSDYTFVAFKRWVKGVGDLLLVFVILSEASPEAALKRLFSRVAFVLIPLSVLLIKYYPDLGRTYNYWTFQPLLVGVCDNKNTLGMLCMICGLGALWQFLAVYRNHKAVNRTGQLLAQGALIAMIIWLLSVADSVTALCCFIIAGGLMLVTSATRIMRRPLALQILIISIVSFSLLFLFADSAGWLVSALGRDSTLTGRTNIWRVVLGVSGNSWFGAGFESFWTGERLRTIWANTMNGLNEGHNGYIEVYLNLGWVGVMLLAGLIVTGYRNVIGVCRRGEATALIKLALFVAALLYNFCEAGFREINLVWVSFLIAITFAPQKQKPVRDPALSKVPLTHSPLREVEA